MAGTLSRKMSRWKLTMTAGLFPTSTTPSRQWPSLPATYTVSAEMSFKRYPKQRTPGSAKSWLSVGVEHKHYQLSAGQEREAVGMGIEWTRVQVAGAVDTVDGSLRPWDPKPSHPQA